jgi:hypothetical protein
MPVVSIEFPRTFHRREGALKAARIKYEATGDGDEIILEREPQTYSKHEQDVIAFVRNPLFAIEILGGLDLEPARAIVRALKETYLDSDGKWD